MSEIEKFPWLHGGVLTPFVVFLLCAGCSRSEPDAWHDEEILLQLQEINIELGALRDEVATFSESPRRAVEKKDEINIAGAFPQYQSEETIMEHYALH